MIDTAERRRVLAAMLRSGSAEAKQHRAEERQRQRDQEAERKREVQRLLDQRAATPGRGTA